MNRILVVQALREQADIHLSNAYALAGSNKLRPALIGVLDNFTTDDVMDEEGLVDALERTISKMIQDAMVEAATAKELRMEAQAIEDAP